MKHPGTVTFLAKHCPKPSTLVLLIFVLLCSCQAHQVHQAEAGSADSSLNQDIFISEILASNTLTNLDPDYSTFSDWIEIHNSGHQNVDLNGFYLTDDLNAPIKWQIPPNTIIPPSGFVLFWADGRNRGRHTNFSLLKRGEQVGLFDPQGAFIDAIKFTGQTSDVSLGRQSDKNSAQVCFSPPSPNAANNVQDICEKTRVAPPHFSVSSGFYDKSQDLALAAPFSPPAAIIRYTLNGATPTDASPVYTSPIHIDLTTVVRASTFFTGYLRYNQKLWIGEK